MRLHRSRLLRTLATLVALPLAAACAGALLVAPRPPMAHAQGAPRAAFEYHVELADHEAYKQTDEYRALERELKDPWRAQFAYHQRILARAGAEGWELVDVLVPKSPAQTVFYLRRRAG